MQRRGLQRRRSNKLKLDTTDQDDKTKFIVTLASVATHFSVNYSQQLTSFYDVCYKNIITVASNDGFYF